MELANDDATMAMEHRTTYLATVGTLGPMIGLVGTVYGMILSFRVIATAGGSPQASQLAAGISTALFATLEGIALSIPAIFFHAMFRNRIARLSLEVALAAESLLEQFAPGIRSPHPLAASAVSPQRPSPGGTVAFVNPTRREAERWRTGIDRGPKGPFQLNLTPLLDVVLQLITFFMMLIHFGTKIEGAAASIKLPTAPSALPTGDLGPRPAGRGRRRQGRA